MPIESPHENEARAMMMVQNKPVMKESSWCDEIKLLVDCEDKLSDCGYVSSINCFGSFVPIFVRREVQYRVGIARSTQKCDTQQPWLCLHM